MVIRCEVRVHNNSSVDTSTSDPRWAATTTLTVTKIVWLVAGDTYEIERASHCSRSKACKLAMTRRRAEVSAP